MAFVNCKDKCLVFVPREHAVLLKISTTLTDKDLPCAQAVVGRNKGRKAFFVLGFFLVYHLNRRASQPPSEGGYLENSDSWDGDSWGPAFRTSEKLLGVSAPILGGPSPLSLFGYHLWQASTRLKPVLIFPVDFSFIPPTEWVFFKKQKKMYPREANSALNQAQFTFRSGLMEWY